MSVNVRTLIEKIRLLPRERLTEVDDFADFLRHKAKRQAIDHATAKLSEPAFAEVWVNAEDQAYDAI